MKLTEGELAVGRRKQTLIAGSVVLIDPDKDLVGIRKGDRTGETHNFRQKDAYSIAALIDSYENGGSNDKLLPVIRALIEGNVSETIQQAMLEELKNVPKIKGQEVLEAFL